MTKILHIIAAGALLVGSVGSAGAQPNPADAARSRSLQEHERFQERIQRSNRRATTSICEGGCRGEFRGRSQPKDPFARLPDHSDEPSGTVD